MYSHFDFEKSHIIKPPTTHFDADRKSQRRNIMLHIDSRDRDVSRYPNSNRYVIDLEEEIEDVLSAEIMYASIPISTYTINPNNNRFRLVINHTTYHVQLDIGDYTQEEIARQLASKIEHLSGCRFDATIDKPRGKFIFSSDRPFAFVFAPEWSPSCHKLLGFRHDTYEARETSPPHTFILEPPFRAHLSDTDYALLQIAGFHNFNSVNTAMKKTFAIVPAAHTPSTITSDSFRYQKSFNPPMAKLAKLQIEFKDRFGKPFDLQNQDHYFVLRIEVYRHSPKYASFIDM